MTNRTKMRSRKRRAKTVTNENNPHQLFAQNYCLGFIDLLGQKKAMEGQTLLPDINLSTEEYNAFITKMRTSVGAIATLQKRAEELLKEFLGIPKESPLRNLLPPHEQYKWDQSSKTQIHRQRWSDGLVLFSGLNEQDDIFCKMNAVFGIFGLAGALCLFGLASQKPIRGAIDIAWGMELHPQEIYGPVVARAASLESKIAKWPRIIVSDTTIGYLNSRVFHPNNDSFTEINRSLAKLCLDMIIRDEDNQPILHYLGQTFYDAVSSSAHQQLYDQSVAFISEQLQIHQTNEKLFPRYVALKKYFESFPPPQK